MTVELTLHITTLCLVRNENYSVVNGYVKDVRNTITRLPVEIRSKDLEYETEVRTTALPYCAASFTFQQETENKRD